MTTDFNSWEDVEQYLKDGGQVYVNGYRLHRSNTKEEQKCLNLQI